MAIVALCTSADLAIRISATGVSLRSDDDTTSDDWACTRGSLDVYAYAVPRYTPAQLQGSAAATEIAADCSLYYLCARRANPIPKTVQIIYDRAMAFLLGVQSGKLSFFDIVPLRESSPVMSNHHTVLEPYPHSVVDRQQTTGSAPEGYRRHLPPYEESL